MDDRLATELRRVIETDDGGILAAAREVTEGDLLRAETPEEQLVQLVHAVRAMLLEALEGGDETRRLVIETAIPAYVEAGDTAATIGGAITRFAVLVAEHIGSRVEPDLRTAAVAWLASFYARYVCETLEAVEAAR